MLEGFLSVLLLLLFVGHAQRVQNVIAHLSSFRTFPRAINDKKKKINLLVVHPGAFNFARVSDNGGRTHAVSRHFFRDFLRRFC